MRKLRTFRPRGPHKIQSIYDFKTKDGRMHGQFKNNWMPEIHDGPPYQLWTAFMMKMRKVRGTYRAKKGGRDLQGWAIGGGRREHKFKRSRLYLDKNGHLQCRDEGVCVYVKFGRTWLQIG